MNFPSINKYVTDKDHLILPGEHSKEQVNIPEVIQKNSGGLLNTIKLRKHVLPRMLGCLYEAKKSATSILKNPHEDKKTISEEVLCSLETFIHSLGINDIGYTKVDQSLIFKDKAILYTNAIVITMEMKAESISTAPSPRAIKEIFRTYYELGKAVNLIADYLREKGYNAMAGPAIGGDVSYVPLARDAGLGVIGKHGLLISDKSYGPSLRIAAIYTDIENLPFSKENFHMWVQDFCEKCNKCVKACPARAIYEHAQPVGDDIQGSRCIDHSKCGKPFAKDYGCTVCVKSCTFFKQDYYKIKSGYMKQCKKGC